MFNLKPFSIIVFFHHVYLIATSSQLSPSSTKSLVQRSSSKSPFLSSFVISSITITNQTVEPWWIPTFTSNFFYCLSIFYRCFNMFVYFHNDKDFSFSHNLFFQCPPNHLFQDLIKQFYLSQQFNFSLIISINYVLIIN